MKFGRAVAALGVGASNKNFDIERGKARNSQFCKKFEY